MLFDCETCTCEEIALVLHAMDEPIVLCRGETPIAKDWPDHQYTADEIKREFALDPDLNVALILGPRSRLIEIAGEDGAQSERDFRELVDGVFVETPTFESRRGYHRLFLDDLRLEALDRPVLRYKSLSIQVGASGKSVYTLLPPSITEGFKRKWQLTLEDCEGGVAWLPDDAVERILGADTGTRHLWRMQDEAVK